MELTNKILECDKKAFISVNLGEDINFEFDNRDNSNDCRKKPFPSKKNRNQVRKKEFDQLRIEDNLNRSRSLSPTFSQMVKQEPKLVYYWNA